MKWTVEFLEAARAELAELPLDMQTNALHVVELVLVGGPHEVGLRHVRPLGRKLYEMRFHGRDGIARAIYVASSGRRLIVLRVFVKKTAKTPQREIEIARKRTKEIEP